MKHNGDILIEISGAKIEKARHPFEDLMKQNTQKIPKLTARPLEDLQQLPVHNLPGQISQPLPRAKPSFLIYPSVSNQRPMLPANDPFEDQSQSNSCLASMLKVEMNPNEADEPMEIQDITTNAEIQVNVDNAMPAKVNKRYHCELCPYETDSKSQFLYHKSWLR